MRRERSIQRAAPYPARSGASGTEQWTHDLYQPAPLPIPVPLPLTSFPKPLALPLPHPPTHIQRVVGDTVSVTNLPPGVTSDDLTDIFTPLGRVAECVVHYDAGGGSLGTASVRFGRPEEAERAVEEFDGAEVDGREMRVKLVGQVVSRPLALQGLGGGGVVGGFGVGMGVGGGMGVRLLSSRGGGGGGAQSGGNREGREGKKGGGRGRRGEGGKGGEGGEGGRGGRSKGARGGRGGGRPSNEPVKAEDLDADMEAYHTQRQPAAAADAAPSTTSEAQAAAPTES